MKKSFMMILTVPFLLFPGLLKAQHISAKDSTAIVNTLDKQRECWNKGDLECYMQGYWKSDDLRFIGKSGITYGWERTLKIYKKAYPDKEAMGKLIFHVISLDRLSSTSAYMIGSWELKRKKDNPSGYFTLLWEKKNGKWVITADHSS